MLISYYTTIIKKKIKVLFGITGDKIMFVLKFGGSSVGSHQGIEQIISILSDKDHAKNVSVVVVSAFSGVTDTLIELARKALA